MQKIKERIQNYYLLLAFRYHMLVEDTKDAMKKARE